jgi:hypothetical protein
VRPRLSPRHMANDIRHLNFSNVAVLAIQKELKKAGAKILEKKSLYRPGPCKGGGVTGNLAKEGGEILCDVLPSA